ncbi:MAG: hypothetical protein SYC29_08870 [Planctomycetota bacterium]|nr:hypothetical protein [Planctomycetota bacterium]
MTLSSFILVVHAAATLMMTGLIWFVQIVHYPLFAIVGADESVRYGERHTRQTTWVVAPLMCLEAIGAVLIAVAPFVDAPRGPAWIGVALVAVIWLSTALLQVPCHRRLSLGFEITTIRRLVLTNWVRTAAWTVRSIIALWLLVAAHSG